VIFYSVKSLHVIRNKYMIKWCELLHCTAKQISFLLYGLCCRVCEPHLAYMHGIAAVLHNLWWWCRRVDLLCKLDEQFFGDNEEVFL